MIIIIPIGLIIRLCLLLCACIKRKVDERKARRAAEERAPIVQTEQPTAVVVTRNVSIKTSSVPSEVCALLL